MVQRAKVVIEFDDPGLLTKVISPELVDGIGSESITITKGKDALTLNITTDEIKDLRATLNSYLRWLDTALVTRNTIRSWKDGTFT